MLSARKGLLQLGRSHARTLATKIQPVFPFSSPGYRQASAFTISNHRVTSALITSNHRTTLFVNLHRRTFTADHTCYEEDKPASKSVPVNGERTPVGQIEPRLAITFTCAVPDCGHRSTHEFSKRSYTKGIVIIQCPGCKNRHLIADNLSWFTETADEPHNIEQIIAAKGGRVKRGTVFSDGLDGETLEIEDVNESKDDKPIS